MTSEDIEAAPVAGTENQMSQAESIRSVPDTVPAGSAGLPGLPGLPGLRVLLLLTRMLIDSRQENEFSEFWDARRASDNIIAYPNDPKRPSRLVLVIDGPTYLDNAGIRHSILEKCLLLIGKFAKSKSADEIDRLPALRLYIHHSDPTAQKEIQAEAEALLKPNHWLQCLSNSTYSQVSPNPQILRDLAPAARENIKRGANAPRTQELFDSVFDQIWCMGDPDVINPSTAPPRIAPKRHVWRMRERWQSAIDTAELNRIRDAYRESRGIEPGHVSPKDTEVTSAPVEEAKSLLLRLREAVHGPGGNAMEELFQDLSSGRFLAAPQVALPHRQTIENLLPQPGDLDQGSDALNAALYLIGHSIDGGEPCYTTWRRRVDISLQALSDAMPCESL